LGSSVDSANWGSSGDSNRSTPGRQNYLTPLRYNLRLLRTFASGSNSVISVVIQNIGREAASNFSVSLYLDANADSIPQPGELIQAMNPSIPLQPGDSA